MKSQVKGFNLILSISGFVILLAFFLLGTFFDEQISNLFTPAVEHNFYGLFFEIFGMGIYTIPALAMIIVFFNWLIISKKKKVNQKLLVTIYFFVVLLFLTLDSIKVFPGGDSFLWMTWGFSSLTYLVIYLVLFYFFYHPQQKQKFQQNYYRLQSLVAMVIFIVVTYLTVVILKLIFVRPRMMQIIDEGLTYRPWWKISWNPYQIKNNSFPSGHTGIAMSLLSLLFLTKKNSWWSLAGGVFLWIIIIAMGVSRVVYLKHFLTDVISAMMIGGAWFYLGSWINGQKWLTKWEV